MVLFVILTISTICVFLKSTHSEMCLLHNFSSPETILWQWKLPKGLLNSGCASFPRAVPSHRNHEGCDARQVDGAAAMLHLYLPSWFPQVKTGSCLWSSLLKQWNFVWVGFNPLGLKERIILIKQELIIYPRVNWLLLIIDGNPIMSQLVVVESI